MMKATNKKNNTEISISSSHYRSEETYWLEKLSGELVKTSFPLDVWNFEKQRELREETFRIEGEGFLKMFQITKGSNLRIFMVLVAVLTALLEKYTLNQDIILGSPIYKQDIEGEFVNTVLALRNQVDEKTSFKELLLQVRQTILGANENANYPIETLLYQLNMTYSEKDFPLFDIAICLDNIHDKSYIQHIQTSMCFIFSKTNETLEATLEYDVCRYSDSYVEQVMSHFQMLFQGLLTQMDTPLEEITLLTDQEKKILLQDFNSTGFKFDHQKTIHQLFEEQVRKTNQHMAVEYQDTSLTYEYLNNQANLLGAQLRDLGVTTNSIAGVLLERTPEMITSLMAILKAGGAYLPIETQLPPQRKKYMLEDSQANWVITQKQHEEPGIQVSGTRIIDIEETWEKHHNTSDLPHITGSGDLLYVIYTSGTTGRPKGVLINHIGFINLVHYHQTIFGENSRSIMSQVASVTFDAMAFEIWPCLLSGAKCNVCTDEVRVDPRKMRDWLIERKVTISFQPTMMLEQLLKEQWPQKGIALKTLRAAGDKLTRYPGEEIPFQVYNLYGPTEDTVWTTWIKVTKQTGKSTEPGIGKPVGNHTVWITRKTSNENKIQLQPFGITGELCISGQGLSRGYLNNPELTKERFIENPYKPGEKLYFSGDLAKWQPYGEIRFCGRKDQQVKIRGIRVETGEVQYLLDRHPEINEVIVIPGEDEARDKYLCAYYVSEREISNLELREHLSVDLPEYMIPSYFMKIETIPLTLNGKIDKKQLPQPEIKTFGKHITPRNHIEERLVNLWEEILGVKKESISIDSNFFELGGHSLKATILITRIHKELNVKLPLSEFFRTPTIFGISKYIEGTDTDLYASVNSVEKREYYPLSSAQDRLFFLSHFENIGTSYNVPSFFQVNGKLDETRLKASITKMLERHEPLRTSFEHIHNNPVQRIHDKVELEILREQLNQEEASQLQDLLHVFIQPFDLSKAPLLRVKVISLPDQQEILLYDMHHIISDGTSSNLLKDEFIQYYSGKALSPLRIQYKDYASWQNQLSQSGVIRQQEEYWMQVFSESEDIPRLELTPDHPRPAAFDYRGDVYGFVLEKEDTQGLKQLGGRQDTTDFMRVMALVNILFQKYTFQGDFVIGSTIAGRPHADLHKILGMFVNELAIRNFPRGEKRFPVFLREVQKNCVNAFENQDVQFETLVHRLNLERDLSRNPLFDVCLILQNFEPGQDNMEEVLMTPLRYDNHISKFDISIIANEIGDCMHFFWEYSTALFERDTIQRLSTHLKQILRQVIKEPGILIKEIDPLSEEEKQQLIYEWNNRESEYPKEKNVVQLFQQQMNKRPGQMAAQHQEQIITYQQLEDQSSQLAEKLLKKQRRKEEGIGIFMDRSIELIIAFLAIQKTGAAPVPLDIQAPADRLSLIMKDLGMRYVVNQEKKAEAEEYQQLWQTQGVQIIRWDLSEDHSSSPSALTLTTIPSSQLAYILFTSGTTGRPKGVMIEHQSLVNYLYWGMKQYGMTEPNTHVFPLYTAITFDLTMTSLFLPLVSGNSIRVYAENDPSEQLPIERVLSEDVVDILKATPSHLKLVKNQLGKKKRRLKKLIIGGEELETNLAKEIQYAFDNGVMIYNEYGPTEATIGSMIHLYHEQKDNRNAVPIGYPIHNSRIYLLDDNLKSVPINGIGEIYIGGETLARGYVNQQELTQETFCDNPFIKGQKIYRTGDLARRLSDGNLIYQGRKTEQVKIRGFRIELKEIEKYLQNHPEIREVVVVPGTRMEDVVLSAFYVSEKEIETVDIRDYLSGKLPEYMIPSYFVQLENIPVTSTGKLDKRALPQPGTEKTRANDYEPPADAVEELLVDLWADVLKQEKSTISVLSNFFHLGGHSLRATVLVSLIQKYFNVHFPLSRVFQSPTLREFGDYIRTAREAIYQEIKPVEKREYYPQSSAQKRLFFLDHFEEIETSYNMPYIYKINGTLDKERLNIALKKLIQRHEILRTTFLLIDNEAVQRVLPGGEFRLRELDLPQQSLKDDEIQEIVKEFIQPFDLSIAPLLRVGLGSTSEEEHFLLYDLHHIVSDGVSGAILVEEFFRFFSGQEMEPLRVQYQDFSVWQNHLFETGEIKNQEDFWLEVYSDSQIIPRINLPIDFSRPAIYQFEGHSFGFRVGHEVFARYKQVSQQQGATLFMNLLTVLNVLFYKYTGQTDIIVGSSIAGRPHVDLQPLIGMFVNELAMRNYPKGRKSFQEFLEEVKINSVKAFENQDVQFEDLVDKLQVERDPSHNPIFDVCLMVGNFEQSDKQMEEVTFQSFNYGNRMSKFDITFTAQEIQDDLFFNLEYCTALFKEETIQRMMYHLVNIMKEVGDNSAQQISQIDILSKEEREQILGGFNQTDQEYPREKTIYQLFEEQAAQTPDSIAVETKETRITYEALNQQANQVANFLIIEKKMPFASMVGILMNRSLEYVVAQLGVLKAGCAYIPMDPSAPEERIVSIVKDAGISLLFSQKQFIRRLNRLQWECECLETFLCMDTEQVYFEEEQEQSQLMDPKLWGYVVETATDDITAGGWNSSYTGAALARQEMDEYGDNILKKLTPLLHKEMRVLEIGCASGISMYRIAPKTGFYYGTDLSSAMIERNRERIQREKLQNIHLAALPAHEIDKLEEAGFDLVILNSVIQSFHGLHYLRKVLRKVVTLMKATGWIFLGDIMDQDLKQALVSDLEAFKRENKDKNYRTKTDWTTELFVSRSFFQDLEYEIPGIGGMEFSQKIHTIENELTKYRFDAIITVDKIQKRQPSKLTKNKSQEDTSVIKKQITENPKLENLNPRNPAYVIYTSGTTGRQKGVVVEHQSVVNYVYWGKHQYVQEVLTPTLPLYTSISFDLTMTSLYLPLITGGKVKVYQDKGELLPMETITKATPSHLKLIENERIPKESPLKTFIVGGEELTRSLASTIYRKFHNGVNIYNEYGPTEATIGCMIHRYEPREDHRNSVPIGKPIHNSKIYILDKDLNPVPINGIGEIYIGGEVLSRGYVNHPELMEEAFVVNPFEPGKRIYKTGDLARPLPEGKVEFIGRGDDQVKLRGYRIEINEIETRLQSFDGIKEAVVVTMKPKETQPGEGEYEDIFLCAYYVMEKGAGGKIDTPELRDYLARKLPEYMIPTYFKALEEIPVTKGGKLDKPALPEIEWHVHTPETIQGPVDAIEEKLVEIWSQILKIGKESISREANFFQLGGHSLRATILISLIKKAFKVEFPLGRIFSNPLIRECADFIRSTTRNIYQEIKPVEKREYYQQSSAQKRLFFLNHYEEIGVSYNMPSVQRVRGNMDLEKFHEAIGTLIQRHEALRTSFHLLGKEPVQRIQDAISFDIHALSTGSNEVSAGEIQEIIDTFIQPFDLSMAPLLRVGYIPLSEEENVLVYDMHHIIGDGTSLEILVGEFSELYSGIEMTPLKLQYKDFSQWQLELYSSHKIRNQEEYWKNLYTGPIPTLELPTDFPRTHNMNFEGSTYKFKLNPEQAQACKAFASLYGATLYMHLLGIFYLLLFKYTGQEDIIVGSGIAGRPHADLQQIIGMFVNTLPMRNYPTGEKSFKEFLEEVRKNCVKAFENQDMQFEELVYQLKLERESSRNPLFDVEFNVQNFEMNATESEISSQEPEESTGNDLVSPYNYENKTSKFDFILFATEVGDTIHFILEYSTALFKPKTIKEIAKHYKEIVNQVVENPGIKIKDIQIHHQLKKIETQTLQRDFGF